MSVYLFNSFHSYFHSPAIPPLFLSNRVHFPPSLLLVTHSSTNSDNDNNNYPIEMDRYIRQRKVIAFLTTSNPEDRPPVDYGPLMLPSDQDVAIFMDDSDFRDTIIKMLYRCLINKKLLSSFIELTEYYELCQNNNPSDVLNLTDIIIAPKKELKLVQEEKRRQQQQQQQHKIPTEPERDTEPAMEIQPTKSKQPSRESSTSPASSQEDDVMGDIMPKDSSELTIDGIVDAVPMELPEPKTSTITTTTTATAITTATTKDAEEPAKNKEQTIKSKVVSTGSSKNTIKVPPLEPLGNAPKKLREKSTENGPSRNDEGGYRSSSSSSSSFLKIKELTEIFHHRGDRDVRKAVDKGEGKIQIVLETKHNPSPRTSRSPELGRHSKDHRDDERDGKRREERRYSPYKEPLSVRIERKEREEERRRMRRSRK